jgi:N-acetylmuramoyl-L-alanine amidase
MHSSGERLEVFVMRVIFRVAVLLVVAATAVPAEAALSARTRYERALALERAVRPSLEPARPSPAALAKARRVIAAYEAVVRRHPGSGYTDNALWQAAHLAADVWARSGEDRDRAAAERLFTRLIDGYPSSSLVTRAKSELKQLEAAKRAAARDDDDRVLPVPEPERVVIRGVSASPGPAAAKPANGPATIRAIERAVLSNLVRVTIELDREVRYRDERISDPDRVFLDLRSTTLGSAVRATQKFGDGIVRQIRVGRQPEETTRVVLDVDGAVRHSVFTLYNPYRLVIDCERGGAPAPLVATAGTGAAAPARNRGAAGTATAPSTESVPAVALATASPAATIEPPVSLPRSEPVTAEATRDREPLPARRSADPSAAATLSGPPAANLRGRFSLSRQLGLGVSRIVIDPGHGGHDPGARVKGLAEADLVLDVALRLERLLAAQPGVEVVLTRRTDVFVPLEERTAIANREDADLFLSIHANASRNRKASGVETYFLNFASNPAAEAVAARENAASGRAMHSLPDIVKAITLNNKLDESRDFATMVQRSMIERLRPAHKGVRDLGVKQAPFVVLIGAGMPSVLAEVSFVTNPQEGRLLKSANYRQRIAEALFQGIGKYQRSLKGATQTASNR